MRNPNLPRVSVIIPAHNAGWSIARTLVSVSAQTFADFEVIVIDDGSTDLTAVTVRQHMLTDSRIRLVSQHNQGVAAARNYGISQARGVFIAPLDADDIWRPENLARQISALEKSDPPAPFSFAGSYILDEDDTEWPGSIIPANLHADYLTLLRRNWVNCGSAAIFRREAVLAAGSYSVQLREKGAQGAEDWLMILKLASVAPGIVVHDPLVGYRRTRQGMSTKPAIMTNSVLRVIDTMRMTGPKVPPWHFWAARTNVLLWLLPLWYRSGHWRGVLRCLAIAYLANPLWFAEDSARRTLMTGLRLAFKRRYRRYTRTPSPRSAAQLFRQKIDREGH